MKPIGLFLEMELGVTGGEEDGVDNSDVKKEDLYSKPEEIYQVRLQRGRRPADCRLSAHMAGPRLHACAHPRSDVPPQQTWMPFIVADSQLQGRFKA